MYDVCEHFVVKRIFEVDAKTIQYSTVLSLDRFLQYLNKRKHQVFMFIKCILSRIFIPNVEKVCLITKIPKSDLCLIFCVFLLVRGGADCPTPKAFICLPAFIVLVKSDIRI